MNRVTLVDIAKELGVSLGTIDRALHNRTGISPRTKDKILRLIEKYDYKADKAARSLSLRSSSMKIGVITQNEVKFFWDNVINGIRAAESELADFGLEVIMREVDSHRDLKCVQQLMDELVDMRVDAIALVPSNEPQMKEKISEVSEKGIPVVTFNDDIADSKRLFYVGPQIRQSGRTAAELIGHFLRGRGKVFTISLEIPSLEYGERLEGFKEVIRENYRDIEIVGNFSYNYKVSEDKELDILKYLLENIGDIDGIYDITGSYLYDVANIIKGIEKLRNVTLIGHEIWRGVKELINDGTITACISQDPFSQGFFVIKQLFDYLTDHRLPNYERMYTRLDIIMKENLINQDNVINQYFIQRL